MPIQLSSGLGVFSSASLVVAIGGGGFGWSAGSVPYGVSNPSPIPQPLSALGVRLVSSVSGCDLRVQQQASYSAGARGSFTFVSVLTTAGLWQTFAAADAGFNNGQGTWTWGTGSKPLFTAVGSSTVKFY